VVDPEGPELQYYLADTAGNRLESNDFDGAPFLLHPGETRVIASFSRTTLDDRAADQGAVELNFSPLVGLVRGLV
jgi:hypothetical protein